MRLSERARRLMWPMFDASTRDEADEFMRSEHPESIGVHDLRHVGTSTDGLVAAFEVRQQHRGE